MTPLIQYTCYFASLYCFLSYISLSHFVSGITMHYHRAEHTSTWLQGHPLPYQMLLEFPCSMHSLLLEESNIQCCSFFFTTMTTLFVWKSILGTRKQNESFFSSNPHPILFPTILFVNALGFN